MNAPIRWAGGKRYIMEHIRTFVGEPVAFLDLFSGSASVAFALNCEMTWINDNNAALQNFMHHLKLGKLEITEHNNRERSYYLARSEYNGIITSPSFSPLAGVGVCETIQGVVTFSGSNLVSEIEHVNEYQRAAALFYFLNKTSYNGLYRVNKAGYYNAPYGDTAYLPNPNDLPLLRRYQEVMIDWKITALDWRKCLDEMEAREDSDQWVIYADPPYLDLFDGYSPNGFKWRETLALLERLSSLPNRVLLSNSFHKPLIQAAKSRGWEVYAINNHTSISAARETRGTRRECLFFKRESGISGNQSSITEQVEVDTR